MNQKTLYIASFLIATVFCGLVFVTVQQDLRQTANDPQIEIAEEFANNISGGQLPQFSEQKLDLNKSLSTWVAFYDKDGNPLASNASLDGQLPKPPSGIFTNAQKVGQYNVTWQPKKEIRQALVVKSIVNNDVQQYIVAGRSLREIEKREKNTLVMSGIAWLALLIISFGAIRLSYAKITPKEETKEEINTTPTT